MTIIQFPSGGSDGQDRESYTDDQDRESYTLDPEYDMDEDYPNYTKDENGYIHEEVHVDLSEVVEADTEGFIDLLSTLAIGDDLLMDVTWEVIGTTNENLIQVIVHGDPSASEEVRCGR